MQSLGIASLFITHIVFDVFYFPAQFFFHFANVIEIGNFFKVDTALVHAGVELLVFLRQSRETSRQHCNNILKLAFAVVKIAFFTFDIRRMMSL